MVSLSVTHAVELGALLSAVAFCRNSPSSRSTKAWLMFYSSVLAMYLHSPASFQATSTSIRHFAAQQPVPAIIVALVAASSLRYIQQKLRFARLNAIKWKFNITDEPASWENMTIEQAQEIERNMAEWEFPRLWQFGWISDFFRTSTDPGVSRTISASGHFINEDKRIEHQRMQATIHLMTGLAAYQVKSRNSSLVIARINEHHHRHGIKINSDDVLYLMIHFGLAPVPWINKFGYRKLEPFEVQAIWTLWRELACRMGVKYIPKDLKSAMEWRKNFENTFRWREDANEKMATAMLDQVLYPIPRPFKNFVAQVFVSIVDWDIVYYCQLEKYNPSPVIREVVHDLFRFCGFMIRHFGLPRLSPYRRSPEAANKQGKMVFPHTPYDTMPWWQEKSFWNLWGPRALLSRLRGMPLPSSEYESEGVAFQAMGAPHKHPATQSSIERRVLENAAALEKAPYGYRSAVGFQVNRLLPPVDGPVYGSDMNTFPAGTPTTPNNPIRFTREYERRAMVPQQHDVQPEDVAHVRTEKTPQNAATKTNGTKIVVTPVSASPLASTPVVSALA